jgi:hypothetical protein
MPKSPDAVVVSSKLRAIAAEEHMRCSSELMDAVSEKVRLMFYQALNRARANGRNTIRPQDL